MGKHRNAFLKKCDENLLGYQVGNNYDDEQNEIEGVFFKLGSGTIPDDQNYEDIKAEKEFFIPFNLLSMLKREVSYFARTGEVKEPKDEYYADSERLFLFEVSNEIDCLEDYD